MSLVLDLGLSEPGIQSTVQFWGVKTDFSPADNPPKEGHHIFDLCFSLSFQALECTQAAVEMSKLLPKKEPFPEESFQHLIKLIKSKEKAFYPKQEILTSVALS